MTVNPRIVQAHCLLDLPVELVIKIFLALDNIQTLLNCRQLCRRLRVVIDGAAALQYKLELHISGVTDGSQNELGSIERLDKLKEYTKEWEEMKWVMEKTITLPESRFLVRDNVVAYAVGDKGLSFVRLPSRGRNIEERSWSLSELDVESKILYFDMDPSQDLLIMVEWLGPRQFFPFGAYGIHLRNMSTGQRHPLAARDVIVHDPPDFNASHRTYESQIFGDLLGVVYRNTANPFMNQLLVWNWKSLDPPIDLSSRRIIRKHIAMYMVGFTFFSYRYIMLCLTDGNESVIQIHDIHQRPLEYRRAGTVGSIAAYVSMFCFPRPGPEMGHILSTHSSAAPCWDDSALRFDSTPGNFFAKPDRRLIIFTMKFSTGVPMLLFVPHSTIDRHLYAIERRIPGGREFAWDDWGPNGTRLMPALPAHLSARQTNAYVRGFKYVVAMKSDTWGTATIQIYDFNDRAIRRELGKQIEDEDVYGATHITRFGMGRQTELVTSTTHITTPAFKGVVSTSLPYRITRFTFEREEGATYTSPALSEDAVLIPFEAKDHSRNIRVLGF